MNGAKIPFGEETVTLLRRLVSEEGAVSYLGAVLSGGSVRALARSGAACSSAAPEEEAVLRLPLGGTMAPKAGDWICTQALLDTGAAVALSEAEGAALALQGAWYRVVEVKENKGVLEHWRVKCER